MKKHNARETTSRVSSFTNELIFFNNVGRKNIPETNHNTRKKASLNTEITISVPENVLLTATVESNTMSRTAAKSSITNTPVTIPANF